MWRANCSLISQQWNRLISRQRDVSRRYLSVITEEKKPNCLEAASHFKPGDRIHGYTVNKVLSVPELFLVSVQLTHDNTGAQHLHISRDDSNNVFCVGFRTTPMDSTGVSHILEHTVLCGSRRFPVRDPFFKMLNRSLSTFMNAFTASDFTMYPFATQNAKDFENLLSVYLDAAFFPQLREQDFRQEGWRLEPEDLSDPTSHIIFKGVVFNEMKGAMSSAESLFLQHAQKNLLPSHTYSNNSGGDPLSIPDLTWQQLKDFHSSHYHPSNSRFYTYGDLPLECHLEQIENKVLRHFDKISVSTGIPPEPRWSQPRETFVTCPVDPMAPNPDKQSAVGLHYLTGRLVYHIDEFVLNSDNIDSYSGLLLMCCYQDVDAFGKSEGFPPERIEAALHTIELGTKHQSSNFGLGLIMSIASMWNHDADPSDFLPINDRVQLFKEKLASGPFLQDKVKECFKDNPHCLTLVMSPDPEYEKDLNRKEEEKLRNKVNVLSEEDKTIIYNKGLELAEKQNTPEDLSCLPKMMLTDIDPSLKPVSLERYISAGVPVQYCEQPTNGITYFRAISSISDIPEDLRIYLPLFCYILTRMGAGNLDHRELHQLMKLRTGAMSLSTHVTNHHSEMNAFEQVRLPSDGKNLCQSFRSSDLKESHRFVFQLNAPAQFHCLHGFINLAPSCCDGKRSVVPSAPSLSLPNLSDTNLLRTLVNLLASDLAMSISQSGHLYATMMACSSLSPASHLVERFGGISQVLFMKSLAEMEDLTPVVERLGTIAVEVLEGTQFRCSVNSTAEGREAVETALEGFCDSLPSSRLEESSHVKIPDYKAEGVKTHFQVPFPVNYVSRCLLTVPYTHQDFAKLRILANLMSAKFLHREIREKGGAYGSGAKISGGIFSFYSYR
ncbi:PREDICTED: presequence protease, mitochondrial-like [Acropora digitifera]|uniref:presequence protease, mitochondrial-like n=1 Tax=Acropora digitifera TaxID=70779 RepID=UPI00077A4D1F|nr:PREDICTED: presequence protease, mitochondrial-like [Acropora digitifera]